VQSEWLHERRAGTRAITVVERVSFPSKLSTGHYVATWNPHDRHLDDGTIR
jgi:hypothetical protein